MPPVYVYIYNKKHYISMQSKQVLQILPSYRALRARANTLRHVRSSLVCMCVCVNRRSSPFDSYKEVHTEGPFYTDAARLTESIDCNQTQKKTGGRHQQGAGGGAGRGATAGAAVRGGCGGFYVCVNEVDDDL